MRKGLMADNATDKEIIERVKSGEKEAYDLLVLKYQQRVINLISRFVKNHSDALDVSQETFIKAYRALPNFCLLYTSPSPRDRTRSRMPSSA